nr:ribonuclease H-like domain-containing protein [Tanacetum cinerariifolium]
MDKEHVLGEFDAIKATVSIIDKRTGEVSIACLEKELDSVKDRLSLLEKAIKLRYHGTSEDSVKQVCNKSDNGVSDVFHQEIPCEKHQFTGEGSAFVYAESQDKYSGSVAYDDMLAPVDMMANEENISDTKLDERVVGDVNVDCATVEASPPHNEQNLHTTVRVEDQEHPPAHKQDSLNANVEVQDYALWDAIENGNSFVPVVQAAAEGVESSTTLSKHVTTEDKLKKKNDVKARSLLLMALPNEHQLTFNQYKDAKSLFAAIEARFGGNEATKKTHKTLLKQKSQLVHKDLEQVHEDDLEEMDLKWQLALLTMVAIDGVGFDWSYMAKEEVPTNMALMAFLDFELEFEGYGPKSSKIESQNVSEVFEPKENSDALFVQEQVLEDLEKKTMSLTSSKVEFVKTKEQIKPIRKIVKYAEMYRSKSPRGTQRMWNGQKSQQLGSEFVMYNKACLVCGSFNHLQGKCIYHQRESLVQEINYLKVNYSYSPKKTYPNAQRNMVPRAVLIRTSLKPFNTVRHVNTAHPETTVHGARPISQIAPSTVRRPIQHKTALTNRKFHQKVNTAKGNFSTARPKAVNTARPNVALVNAVKENQGHLQKEQEDQGYVDSGCSRHMTGNMSYLTNFMEYDGGYVTFRGGENSGRITGNGYHKKGQNPSKIGQNRAQNGKRGKRNVEYPRALLHSSIAQDKRTTTKRVV